jgi:hypothetical protein
LCKEEEKAMKKTFLPLALFCIALFASYGFAITGSGTEGDPYIQTSCQDLQEMNGNLEDPNIFFVMGSNIDCSGFGNFTPIGVDDLNAFKGSFDGNFNLITDLQASRATYVGLFGWARLGSSIRNVGLIDFNIIVTGSYGGTLAGSLEGADVNSVYASGGSVWTDTATQYVGGLVGFLASGSGEVFDGNVSNCYQDGVDVNAGPANSAGGLIGRVNSTAGATAHVINSYSTGLFSKGGGNSNTNPVIGDAGTDTEVYSNLFFDVQTVGDDTSDAQATGLSTVNAKKEASYTNWDFVQIWNIGEDTTYPYLRGFSDLSTDTIDANFVAIDGNSFFADLPIFSSIVDSNLTIDFNVFDASNQRLTAELRYSLTQVQDSGTIIIDDVNLDSGVCADQNWSDVPSTCSWDWDISGIDDGNYFLLVEIDSGTASDFNASIKSVRLQTRLDLNVFVPINEETNLPINEEGETSYYFIVKISDGNVLTIYNDNSDANVFSVRTGVDIITDIDTNATSTFYGRRYYFNFPSTQSYSSLQPYLVPVSSGILTTIKVQKFENLTPLSGITIRAYKFLPGGRTLVHEDVTDFKGETAIPFVIADAYELEIYQDGVLVSTQPYTATSTTSSYYIFISEVGTIASYTQMPAPTVVFSPLAEFQTTTDVNISMEFESEFYDMSRMTYFVQNNDTNLLEVTDFAIPTDTNTYYIVLNQWVSGADLNYYLSVNIILTTSDGNEFRFVKYYNIKVSSNDPWFILKNSAREMFGCPTNTSVPCNSLMFVAFFFMFLMLAGLSAGLGANGTGLSIMALIMTGFFTIIGWIVPWIGVFMAMACLGVIMARERFG